MNRRSFIWLSTAATVGIFIPKLPDHYRWKGRVLIPSTMLHPELTPFWLQQHLFSALPNDPIADYMNCWEKVLADYQRQYHGTWK